MDRQQVYAMIDSERDYQEAHRVKEEATYGEWMDAIYSCMTEPRLPVEARPLQLRRIAALAVAALEQFGCSPCEEGKKP